MKVVASVIKRRLTMISATVINVPWFTKGSINGSKFFDIRNLPV